MQEGEGEGGSLAIQPGMAASGRRKVCPLSDGRANVTLMRGYRFVKAVNLMNRGFRVSGGPRM